MTAGPVELRWRNHISNARRKGGSCPRLTRAIHRHGASAFRFEVIARLPTGSEALIAERVAIALLRPALNLTAGGEGTWGRKASAETRAKIAAKAKGKRSCLGRVCSPETRAKISAANSGVAMDPEVVERRAAKRRGQTLTAEHRAAISAGNMGKKMSAKACAKMSESAKRRRRDRDPLTGKWK